MRKRGAFRHETWPGLGHGHIEAARKGAFIHRNWQPGFGLHKSPGRRPSLRYVREGRWVTHHDWVDPEGWIDWLDRIG